MDKMNGLFEIIKKERIYLEYTNLLNSTCYKLLGLYLTSEFGPSIFLDKSLELPENRRLHYCVMTEEVAHHITVPRSCIFKIYGNYSANYNYEIAEAQDEYKAMVWYTNYLIPNEELYIALNKGCKSIYDIAEYFDVTEWMVYRKFGVIKAKYREKGFKLRSGDYFKPHIYKF